MNARPFTQDDYQLYAQFLGRRNRPVPGLSFLPPTGIVVESEGKIIAVGFLTKTDTPVASIGNLATDPDASGEERGKALDLLISSLEGAARAAGYALISSLSNHRGMWARHAKLGYIEAEDGLKIHWRYLCPISSAAPD